MKAGHLPWSRHPGRHTDDAWPELDAELAPRRDKPPAAGDCGETPAAGPRPGDIAAADRWMTDRGRFLASLPPPPYPDPVAEVLHILATGDHRAAVIYRERAAQLEATADSPEAVE